MRVVSLFGTVLLAALPACATILGISEGNPEPNVLEDDPGRSGDGTVTPGQGSTSTADGGTPVLDACAPCPGESMCTDLNTNARNCGRCGHDCRGSKCTLGACEPTVIASGQENPVDIAIDGQRVYWVNNGSAANQFTDGAARYCTKSDCTSTSIVSTSATAPTGVATDGASMFYTTAAGGGSVMTCPNGNCGSPVTLASNQANVFGLAVDGSSVIFSLRSVGGSPASIRYVPKAGGPVATFVNAPGFLDATFLSVHQKSSRVYFTQTAQGLIGRCNTNGTCMENGAFASIGTTAAPTGVTFDGTRAYYTQGTVIGSVTPGSSDFRMFATDAAAHSVVTDGDEIYWSQNDGSIIACPKGATCAPDKRLVLARSQLNPTRLVVDKEFVYWVNSWPNGGAVVKVPR